MAPERPERRASDQPAPPPRDESETDEEPAPRGRERPAGGVTEVTPAEDARLS